MYILKIGKGTKIALIVIVVVVAILLNIFVLPLVTESPSAVLMIESGTVEVAQSPYRQVSGETLLKQGDSIRTGPGSRATVVLFGSSVVRLDENTEINLQEFNSQKSGRAVTIKQNSGRIWNKVVKLSGVDSYKVETPTSVATIRGTGFDNYMKDGGNVDVSVVEGTVNALEKETQQDTDVNAGEAGVVRPGLPPAVRALTEDDWIRSNRQKDEQFAQSLKERIKRKYWVYIALAKSQYGLTDVQVDEYLDGAISGKYTQEQIDSALDQLGIEIKI